MVVNAESRKNNFDLLRLAGALFVMYSHAFYLTGAGKIEPMANATKEQLSFGSLGVLIFFSISGFLITKSYVQRNSALFFLKARIMRIIPALIPLVILCVFVLGPVMTHLTMGEYFSDKMTFKYLRNIFPLFTVYYDLPGVFVTLSFTAVNGSLWTLPLELKCYLGVLGLGIIKFLKKFYDLPHISFVGHVAVVILAEKVFSESIYRNQLIFAIGGFHFLLFRYLKFNIFCFLVAIFGMSLCIFFEKIFLGFSIFGTYLLLYIAYTPYLKLWDIMKGNDLSYGIYIYSFPIQQIVTEVFNLKMKPYQNFFMSLPMVLFFAFLSWHLVERPLLQAEFWRYKSITNRKLANAFKFIKRW